MVHKVCFPLKQAGGWGRVHHRLCKQNLDAASQQLRKRNDSLAAAREVISSLKGRVSELQLRAMDQKVQVKHLESEKQELKEQLELQQR